MKKKNGFDTVAGLLLICLFALFLFFSLSAGAGIYKDISAVMEEQYSTRTALGYVSSRVHQGDEAGCIALGELGGVQSLIVSERLDGDWYDSYIYCCGGYIRELCVPRGESFPPEDGLPVVAAEELSFEKDGGLIRVSCVTAAGMAEELVALRCGGDAR